MSTENPIEVGVDNEVHEIFHSSMATAIKKILEHEDSVTKEDLAHARSIALAKAFASIKPKIRPIPLSEREPTPEDCTAEGECWYNAAPGMWALDTWQGNYTHWLPYDALPDL